MSGGKRKGVCAGLRYERKGYPIEAKHYGGRTKRTSSAVTWKTFAQIAKVARSNPGKARYELRTEDWGGATTYKDGKLKPL